MPPGQQECAQYLSQITQDSRTLVDAANSKVYTVPSTINTYVNQYTACTTTFPHPHITWKAHLVIQETWAEHYMVSSASRYKLRMGLGRAALEKLHACSSWQGGCCLLVQQRVQFADSMQQSGALARCLFSLACTRCLLGAARGNQYLLMALHTVMLIHLCFSHRT